VGCFFGVFSYSRQYASADIFLSLGKRFQKFIPQEFLPLVRDKVLCAQLIAYGLVAAAGLQQPVSKPNYVSLWKFKKPGNYGVLHALAINYREFP